MLNYDKTILPTYNESDIMLIKLGFTIQQLIEIVIY